MNTNLKKPCKNCPFRTDVIPYLSNERAEEIGMALMNDNTFSCHKYTNSLGHEGEEEHCAGAMIMLEHCDKPNQWMRISERLGMYDRRKLDMDQPVFKKISSFIKAVRKHNDD